MSDERTETVELPAQVVARVEDRLPRTEFDSPDEYVAYVMEEVLHHVEARGDEEVEPVNEDQVRDRLESLGYLTE